ncbi:hypothetical protein DENSPDRAFT_64645 [Dentipellis sp. KUC8613]|nr:hypothetical protein DENSPDRAFT_64645 [Dentipellis sp. KUC8613]
MSLAQSVAPRTRVSFSNRAAAPHSRLLLPHFPTRCVSLSIANGCEEHASFICRLRHNASLFKYKEPLASPSSAATRPPLKLSSILITSTLLAFSSLCSIVKRYLSSSYSSFTIATPALKTNPS